MNTTQSPAPGLLPCPMCGSAATLTEMKVSFRVECTNDECQVMCYGLDEKYAAERWNQRRSPSAEQPGDELCPNCLTPWKCNGPHEPAAAKQAVDEWAIDECERIALAYAQCENPHVQTDRQQAVTKAFAKLRASLPAAAQGWQLVPKEPTVHMFDQAENAMIFAESQYERGDKQDAHDFPTYRIWQAVVAYRAMLAAAPSAERAAEK